MQTISSFFAASSLIFCLYTFFVSNITKSVKSFNGESQIGLLMLNIYALAGSIVGVVFLVVLGFKTHWYTPIGFLVVNIMFNLSVGYYISQKVKNITISIVGFFIVPLAGILMFLNI
jgi:hypothetical protein